MKRQHQASATDGNQSSLDVLAAHVAVIDASGSIVAVNAAWRAFAHANGADLARTGAGVDYLAVCERAGAAGCSDANSAAAAIRSVIAGDQHRASMQYQCDAPGRPRWCQMQVTRSPAPGPPRFVIEHAGIDAPTLAERRIRLQENMLASVEQAVIATDLAGTILYWNPFAEQLYGWAAEEVLGRDIVEIIALDSTRAQAGQIMARLQRGESWSGEFHVRHRCGHAMTIHVTNSPMRDERNRLIGVIGISKDISERKLMEKALQLSDMVYQAIGEAIMVVDMGGRVVAINPAFTRLTGYAEAEIIGHATDHLKPADADDLIPPEAQPLLEKTGHWAGSVWSKRKDGEPGQDWLRIDTIYDGQGRDKLRICMFSRITDQKRAKETIWQQANFDTLTGLPNRSMFRDRLEHELNRAGRDAQQLALMLIDLDQFKEVNDTLGHAIGDALLKLVAERIVLCVRAIDTVARLGGDEFTVILGQLNDHGIVARVARTVVQTVAQPFHIGENTIYVSASIGIALYPEDARDADTLIKHADQAMYAAKNSGRNQFHYFTPAMQREAQARMRTANDMRNALANHQFELLYQPIVDLDTGVIHKAEALLRWRHPVRGTVNPADFIAIAEQTGMIAAIGAWVCREVSVQAERWRRTLDPAFQISVNISPMQLKEGGIGLGARLDEASAVARGGMPVIVEITEGMLLDSSGAVIRQLQLLRDAGVELAIDDFGTGYSALAYLRKFHVDYLKIDRTFVTNLVAGSDDVTMCEAIIVMAHKLGIEVIAEGIEREDQRALLAQAGCDYGQGFLFSRPIPADGVARLLAG